jgi:hypothetical protein
MLNSAILEVIVGLVFVYILLSLLVSQINTIIANVLNIRARQLRTRIERIIFDEQLQKTLLAHPVIGMIQPKSSDKSRDEADIKEMETARVSNVDPKTFAKAMINVLSDPFLNLYSAIRMVKDTEERAKLLDITNQLKVSVSNPKEANAVLTQLHETITQLQPPGRADRRAMLRTLSPLQAALKNYQAGNTGLLMVLDGVSNVENRAFQRAMETILSGVGTIKEAELAIEDWFNNRMEQTSQWYATFMQYLSLGVGLVLALMLNIDSIHLSLTLWNDETLRTSVAQAAQSADLSRFFDEEGNVISVPTTVAVGEADSDDTDDTEPDNTQALIDSYEAAQETLNQLLQLRLPIGWTFTLPGNVNELETSAGQAITVYDPLTDSRNLYRMFAITSEGWLGFVLSKITGLFITAIAVAQGAPFWFDVLRRIAGGDSPSKAGEQE